MKLRDIQLNWFRGLLVPVIGTLAFLFASTASAATWEAQGEDGLQMSLTAAR